MRGRRWAVAGALVLLLPVGPRPAFAETGWLPQDLGSADRIGLVLASGTLRLDGAAEPPASLRRERGAPATGLATFPEQALERPTDTVDVRVGSSGDPEDVLAEVRGVRADGMWTEWYPAPDRGGRITLDADVSRVQLRVGIDGADTAVTGLGVRPLEGTGDIPAGLPDDPSPEAAPRPEGDGGPDGGGEPDGDGGDPTGDGDGAGVGDDIPERPFSARLFATRIGLVGETTANGHTVRANDHFVALPSRRGLAARGGGEYTVRVCTTGALGPEGKGDTEGHEARCAYLPVWDVGPWNITDDHWNADRQSWRDLDRGRPQAQAAYTEGHNGGLDGFGRRVRNPAGIDLADGAFNDGLRLPTNGWVQVDYLWTGEYRHRVEVTAPAGDGPVEVRGGAGPEHPAVGTAAHSANIDVVCQEAGARVTGPQGTGDAWYRIGEGHYIPAVYAEGGADAPVCASF